MACNRVASLLTAAALGEIDQGRMTELLRHLSECRECRAELRRRRWLVRMVDCALLGLPAMAGLPHWAAARTG
jgi:anti-sigma factor RsiW